MVGRCRLNGLGRCRLKEQVQVQGDQLGRYSTNLIGSAGAGSMGSPCVCSMGSVGTGSGSLVQAPWAPDVQAPRCRLKWISRLQTQWSQLGRYRLNELRCNFDAWAQHVQVQWAQ